MSKDMSFLNTGMSSAADRRLFEKQKEMHDQRKAEKEAVKASLNRDGTVVQEWIDQEIKDTADLTKIIMNVDSEDNVRAQLLARQMHIDWLKRAKSKVNKYMKEPKGESNG